MSSGAGCVVQQPSPSLQITKWVTRRRAVIAFSRTRRLSLRSVPCTPIPSSLASFELLPLRGGRRSRAREASNVEPAIPFAGSRRENFLVRCRSVCVGTLNRSRVSVSCCLDGGTPAYRVQVRVLTPLRCHLRPLRLLHLSPTRSALPLQ